MYIRIVSTALIAGVLSTSCGNVSSNIANVSDLPQVISSPTEFDTGDEVIHTSKEELTKEQIYEKLFAYEMESDESIEYSAIQDEIVRITSNILETDVEWSELIVIPQIPFYDSRYTYIVITPMTDCNFSYMLELSVSRFDIDGETKISMVCDWQRWQVYGRRGADEMYIQAGSGSPNMVSKKQILEMLDSQSQLTGYEIKYIGINIKNDMLGIPIYTSDKFYYVTAAIDGENFVNVDITEIDFDTLSVYDFFVTYNCFGIEPLEINDYVDNELSPRNAIIEYYNDESVFEKADYIISNYCYPSYVRIKIFDDNLDDTFELIDVETGKNVNVTDIREDIGYEDLEWRICQSS